MKKTKKTVKDESVVQAWAVLVPMGPPDMEYEDFCFTWTQPHPESKEKSCRVFAIYPTRESARADVRFRGGRVVKMSLPYDCLT